MKIMKVVVLALTLVLLTAVGGYGQSPVIIAPDGAYLGNLNTNPYDPNSVSNPYGRYGSPYSPDSINNPYGVYGSPYSPNSPNNPYSTGTVPVPGGPFGQNPQGGGGH